MKKTASQESPAISPLAGKGKPVAGRTAQKAREAASTKDGFNAVWIDLLPRLSARFKNPEVFREGYRRLFLMGFKPSPAPVDKDEFDLCNVLCGQWEIEADPLEGHFAPGTKSKPKVRKPLFPRKAKPLPIQVSFEPMQNGKLNPTFTYPNKDWIEGIRKVKTKRPKKTPSKLWLKALGEDEPCDELRLALLALEFDCRAELGDLCQRALTDSDPQAFQRLERFWQVASILRGKLTKDQRKRVKRARRFIECFERLCLKNGFPPTKRALREACMFKVDDPNPAKVRVMDDKQFTREFLNNYGLYWLPVRYPWGDPRKA
jgi:hypothetical protein